MLELLKQYSITEIAFFIVLLATAIKGAITWFDWARERINKKIENDNSKNEVRKELIDDIEELKRGNQEICSKIDKITATVTLLMDSDKDDIKAYITREHHYFCYRMGFIDDYNLDCIEKRYSHYKDEGGNSFIADLMSEIRSLPKKSSVNLYENNENDDIKDNNRE